MNFISHVYVIVLMTQTQEWNGWNIYIYIYRGRTWRGKGVPQPVKNRDGEKELEEQEYLQTCFSRLRSLQSCSCLGNHNHFFKVVSRLPEKKWATETLHFHEYHWLHWLTFHSKAAVISRSHLRWQTVHPHSDLWATTCFVGGRVGCRSLSGMGSDCSCYASKCMCFWTRQPPFAIGILQK